MWPIFCVRSAYSTKALIAPATDILTMLSLMTLEELKMLESRRISIYKQTCFGQRCFWFH